MSEKREIKPFSLYLFYTKEEDKVTILDRQNNEIGTYIEQYNQEEKVFHIFGYNFSKFSIPQLQEYLVFQLKVPLACHAQKVLIEGFPMKKDLTYEILEIFKKEYEGFFKVAKCEEVAGLCNIEISISQPKRTHYIQQAYLRNFSSNKIDWKPKNNKKKARIFVFDLLNEELVNIGNTESEKKFGQRIEAIAYEEYFYSLALENFMANTLEKELPPIFNKILDTKRITTLTSLEKEALVKYIILTWQRSPEARKHMKEAYEKGLIQAIELDPNIELPENTIPVMNEDYLRFEHESMVFKFLDETSELYLLDRILNFKWMLIQARKKDFFYISDNPIVFNNSYYEKQKAKGNDFIAEQRKKILSKLKLDKRSGAGLELTSDHPERRPRVKGVEIYFPISPHSCILLVDWQKGFKRLKNDQINEFLIIQTTQFIYSHQEDYTKVKQILQKHPELKEKKGKRTIIRKILTGKKNREDYKFKAINPMEFLDD